MYDKLSDENIVALTKESLEKLGYKVIIAEGKKETLTEIKRIIPDGATVMNGSSVTLEQIGYLDYLAGENHKWVDMHAKITSEGDKEKRTKLRKEAALADYYLGSVHALTQDGEFVVASNTASQLPNIVYTSSNLIFVVSTKKIVPDLEIAMERLNKHVFPLEDKQSLEKYNAHTALNKVVTFLGEAASNGRKITFILVKENLGF